MIFKFVWGILSACLFIRPFIFETPTSSLNNLINYLLILFSLIYIFSKKPRNSTLIKVSGVFLLSILISLIFSDNPTTNLYHISQYILYLFLFYMTSLLNKKEQRQLISILLLSASATAAYSLRSLFIISDFTLNYLSPKEIGIFAEEFLSRRRTFFPFTSPSLLASYLTMIIMICCGIIFQNISEKKKNYLFFLSIFCLLVSFSSLLFTKSIGGWTAFMFSLLIFLIFRKISRKKITAVGLTLIILFLIIFSARTQENKYFTKPSFSLRKRLSYWKETAEIIRQNPLTGAGPGNFSLPETRSAHNSYLQIWAEIGFLAILSWLAIISLFIRKGLKNLSSSKDIYYKLGLFAGGSVFLIHNLIDYSFFVCQTAFLWWIILGLTENTSLNTE